MQEQEGCVAEMRKKMDSEFVKMMQLQNQVVSHNAISVKVKFMPLIVSHGGLRH